MTLPTEEAMCRTFWKQVLQLRAYGKIKKYDIFCISNNQRGNSMIRQAMDKLLGVERGVSDYHVPGHGYLEAKRITGYRKDGSPIVSKQSEEQVEFQAAIEAKGLKYALFWTPQQGIDLLAEWLNIRL